MKRWIWIILLYIPVATFAQECGGALEQSNIQPNYYIHLSESDVDSLLKMPDSLRRDVSVKHWKISEYNFTQYAKYGELPGLLIVRRDLSSDCLLISPEEYPVYFQGGVRFDPWIINVHYRDFSGEKAGP